MTIGPPLPHPILISTDAKNEADDQFAIVHALLTSTLDVRGVLPAHFGKPESREQSTAEVRLLLDLLGSPAREVTVADGADSALANAASPLPSDASALIVAEVMAEERRVAIAVLGPLTDVASALLESPEIVERDPLVVWVGGPPYEGMAAYSPEFNLINDVAAANAVMASGVEVWQIPMSTYTMVGVGHAELEERLRGTSALGDYLVDQVIAFNHTIDYGPLDFRSLGDSPAIGALMNPSAARWREMPPPRFTADAQLDGTHDPGRRIRVCESFDTRWLIEDMFAKLRAFGRAARN